MKITLSAYGKKIFNGNYGNFFTQGNFVDNMLQNLLQKLPLFFSKIHEKITIKTVVITNSIKQIFSINFAAN